MTELEKRYQKTKARKNVKEYDPSHLKMFGCRDDGCLADAVRAGFKKKKVKR